ncbi:SusC/RagA family TonB-linked outer membrane protein [Formosa agariphila]|nr:TonB-dependent receptor [Formosa agariphila]
MKKTIYLRKCPKFGLCCFRNQNQFILLLLLLLNTLFSYQVYSNEIYKDIIPSLQGITIRGNIIDSEGIPMIGVTVLVQDTTNGTLSDFDGNYEINVNTGDVILFSYVGKISKSVTVGAQTTIDIVMEDDASELDEVIIVGYGTQKKSDLTGSISSVSGEEVTSYVSGDPSQALQGKMAGVRVQSNGGGPGASNDIVIRGVSSFAGSTPLFVIDGMFSDTMDFVNPSDVTSIEVLKDASAAAIYGSRAANGVVIISTKTGSTTEGIRVDIESSAGFQSITNELDWISGVEYANLRNTLAEVNDTEKYPGFNENLDPSVNTIVDELAISSAPLMNTSASIYGSSNNINFNVSANWLDQDGIVIGSSFDKKTMRTNIGFNKGKFKVTESFAVTRTLERPNTIWNLNNNILPTIPFYNPDNEGGYGGATLEEHGVNGNNHVARSILMDKYIERDNLIGSLAMEYEIIDGLVAKVNTGLTYNTNLDYTFIPTFFISEQIGANQEEAELREYSGKSVSSLIEGTVNYDKSINKNSFSLLGGITRQKTTTDTRASIVSGFPSNDVNQISASSNVIRITGEQYVNTLSSLFGRLNYNYDSKYFFSATIRRDGSSRFSEENRYGTFPSVAVGWTISKENFLNDSDFISNMKLRASYGKLGSQQIADYAYIPVLNINSDAVFGTGQNRLPGISQTVFANPDLVWETTKSSDIGLDLGFMNNKLTFTMDYYNKVSENVLVSLEIPPTSGTSVPVAQNAASIENSGFEFSGTYRGAVGDFTFNVSPNITFLHNEVLDLGDNIAPIIGGQFMVSYSTRTSVGEEVASYYGYKVLGIYQSQEEIDNDGAMADANAEPGDFRYADTDGDGILSAEDQTVLGSYIPDLEYGISLAFTFKNFDMNLDFNGVSGVEIYNYGRRKNLLDIGSNMTTEALNYWRPDNTDTDIPRIGGNAQNERASSFLVEDGDYFRLRSMQIGYSLPQSVLDKIKLRKIRIYASGQNVFTITKYSGYYPEIGQGLADEDRVVANDNPLFYAGVDQSTYPTARTFLLGIQLGF